jgi:hypothetical protein
MLSRGNKITGGPNAPFELDWAMTSGTSVAWARDELAHMAIKRRFDRLVFWDIDLGPANAEIFVSMFYRLMSHEVDIVGAQYCGHNFLSSFHGATVENPELRKDGLLEMAQIPLGFSSISVKALLQIMEKQPQHKYILKETAMKQARPDMYEFFPSCIMGPNSPEGKLARIKAAFESKTGEWGGAPLNQAIKEIMDASDYSQNVMVGEDYNFCRMARESGLKLFIDNNLIINHDTSIKLPVRNEDICEALKEQWRLHNDANPEQVIALVDKLMPLLNTDIP